MPPKTYFYTGIFVMLIPCSVLIGFLISAYSWLNEYRGTISLCIDTNKQILSAYRLAIDNPMPAACPKKIAIKSKPKVKQIEKN
jgi:hypothetical protein